MSAYSLSNPYSQDFSSIAPVAEGDSILQRIGAYYGRGADISAYDPGSKRLFVVTGGPTLQVLDLINPSSPTPIKTLDISSYGGAASSVAVNNGIVAVAIEATSKTDPGKVVFFDANGTVLKTVAVGALPNMLTFTPDGKQVLVANEAEPNSYSRIDSVDPVGSVSLIDLADGVANATVKTAGFEGFNGKKAELQAKGVRIYGPNATVAQDLEPECITVSADGQTAWVTLQENNAIAQLNIPTATVTDLLPLGLKDFSQDFSGEFNQSNGLDASDRDGENGSGKINIQHQPVFGIYEPDGIANVMANEQTYLVMANEGNTRNYDGFNEETRVGNADYVLDPSRFPNASDLEADAVLGRLTVTNATGDLNGDGKFDRIEVPGGRSFSVRDAEGKLIFDSGDQFERITAAAVPSRFNSNGTANTFDSRSDDKGPEPECVAIGEVKGRTYAFIGLKRTSGIMVYEITHPNQPVFVQYITTDGDISPAGLTFIAAERSPNGQPLLVATHETSKNTVVYEFSPATRISEIQGAGHVSPLVGRTVTNVQGIVTAVSSNGFYLQDPNPDASDATSEGIFVVRGGGDKPAVGDAVRVTGRVEEFRGSPVRSNDLSVTELNASGSGGSFSVVSQNNSLPAAIVLGKGGRIPPNQIINNDAVNRDVENSRSPFDPAEDGIDFYESLEGMRVQVNQAVAVGPTSRFGEIPVIADDGEHAGDRTDRGGIRIKPDDFNPERILIDDAIVKNPSKVNVSDRFSEPIEGVLDYNFSNFKLLNTKPLKSTSGNLKREITALTGTDNQLTIATLNVENLDPKKEDVAKVAGTDQGNVDDDIGDGKFAALAYHVVKNLKSPDIISLEEVQDNTGAELGDGVMDASLTYQTLIQAIKDAGGPTYEYRDIAPVSGQDGGQPGGNIRVGFLFNPDRVTFVDRPGGSSTTTTTVTQGDTGVELSSSPGRLIDTNLSTGDAFENSRKPLVGEFLFNGKKLFVIANHFNSKEGDQPLFGRFQPPILSSERQRLQQAGIVRNLVTELLGKDPNANVVVLGDFNDFEFSNALKTLTGGGLTDLVTDLPEGDRYTYNFEGNAQVLDHILVSNHLRTAAQAEIDAVHINSEFADQDSDHDPLVARFMLGDADDTLLSGGNSTTTNVATNSAIDSTIDRSNSMNTADLVSLSSGAVPFDQATVLPSVEPALLSSNRVSNPGTASPLSPNLLGFAS
jgi:predicted extracellular nuclease